MITYKLPAKVYEQTIYYLHNYDKYEAYIVNYDEEEDVFSRKTGIEEQVAVTSSYVPKPTEEIALHKILYMERRLIIRCIELGILRGCYEANPRIRKSLMTCIKLNLCAGESIENIKALSDEYPLDTRTIKKYRKRCIFYVAAYLTMAGIIT